MLINITKVLIQSSLMQICYVLYITSVLLQLTQLNDDYQMGAPWRAVFAIGQEYPKWSMRDIQGLINTEGSKRSQLKLRNIN